MRIAKWGLAALLLVSAGIAAARNQSTQTTTPQQTDQKKTQKQDDQQDAVAAAARRAREEKKQQKPAKVWTNDNIPTTPNSINVVGEEKAPATAQANPEAPAAETKPEQPKTAEAGGAPSNDERKADLEKQLADEQEQLKSLATDLDILSRRHQLDQQDYYGKPDYASDTQGAAALQAQEKDIASKQQQVSAQQKKVDDLTAELKELEDKQ